MKVVIADDEPLARSRLRRLLEEIAQYDLVGEASTGRALLELVEEHQPDIALIDIHMPDIDGLQAARRLSENQPALAIIFTTAFSEHALSAFGTNASAYLLKPIKREQLQTALLQAKQSNRAQIANRRQTIVNDSRFIEVRERGRQTRVALSSIIYFQAEDKYTRLVWEGGEHLIDTSLRQLEDRYPDDFLRVHRKVLVAPAAIRGLEKQVSGLHLLLHGSATTPPVSRRLAGNVRKLLKSAD